MLKNKSTQSLTAITLQKFKKNFWSVFSISVIMIVFFESFSPSFLWNGNSITQGGNQNKSFNYLPTSTTNQIVIHDYFTLSYNEKYEQSEWVAYELKKCM